MIDKEDLQERLQLFFEVDTYRRIIAKKEVIIHCHHYNARLQNIIESTQQINGKKIILSATEEVFSAYINNIFMPQDSLEDKWEIASCLYTHLGYGTLDFSLLNEGIVTSSSSHFVEGWEAGFREVNRPVCTFTEGYLQGVIHRITGESTYVREEACMKAGAEQCRFKIDHERSVPISFSPQNSLKFSSKTNSKKLESKNIDRDKIINALMVMPFYGNEQGLIPKFNVYLSNIPADIYNLICIRFLEAMKMHNLLSTAQNLLFFAGEICAVNTLRGIIISPEWYELILPMVKEEADYLYGLIAITNGLGWGNWHILNYEPAEILEMESLNGYEALGYLQYRGEAHDPQCYMLTGVAAGIMELLHGEGTVEERIGTYHSQETTCICCGGESCQFWVEVL